MALSVVAQREVPVAWSDLAPRLRAALEPLGARWLEPIAYPEGGRNEAWIELGPIDAINANLGEGLLTVQVRTAPFGPGYHQRAIDAIDLMGEVVGGWQRVEDTSGYHVDRCLRSLQRSFLRYAHALWSVDEPTPCGPGLLDGAAVGLNLGEGPAEVPAGRVATATGFKSLSWVRRIRDGLKRTLRAGDDAALPREAREAFLWWHPEPDDFDWVQLGRALCTSDVIWRPLTGEDSPEQVEVRERAVRCFERALALDPNAPVPLEELRRLYELLGREEEAARIADRAQREPLAPFEGGYREGWIRCPLGTRWNLQLPGWLRAGCDGFDGHDVFWDDRMTVHLTPLERTRGFSAERESERHLAQLGAADRERAKVELFDNGSVSGYAVLLPRGDHTLVQGQVGRRNERVTFTVLVRTPEACPLALRLGRSLTPLA